MSSPSRTSSSKKFFNSSATSNFLESGLTELLSVLVLNKETILFKIFMFKIIATLNDYPICKNTNVFFLYQHPDCIAISN